MEQRVIKISIRHLVESLYPAEDLGGMGFSPLRAQMGTRQHMAMQKGRGGDYRSEVSVSFDYSYEGLVLALSGRIDGLISRGEDYLVEEVKTTYRSMQGIGEGQEVHWAQAMCYAAIFARDEGLEAMTVRLVYVRLPTQERVTLERTRTADDLMDYFTGLCAAYCERVLRGERRLEAARSSAAGMAFPHKGMRPGQRTLMCGVFEAIETQDFLFANAPTGIGKTVAVLYPAIKAFARGHCEKIFYLTARNTIQEVAAQTIEHAGGETLLRSVVITAKERMCANATQPLVCDPDYCARAKGFYLRLDAALAQLPPGGVIRAEDIRALAGEHSLCPYELSLFVAENCDIIICDYNYAFDPRAKLRRFFDEGGAYTLLIDEAHNLVDRARAMFSAAVLEADYRHIKRQIPKQNQSPAQKGLKRALNAFGKYLRGLRANMQAEGLVQMHMESLDEEAMEAARAAFIHLEAMQLANEWGEDFADGFFNLRSFLDIYDMLDDTYGIYAEIDRRNLVLNIQCLDTDARLREANQKVQSAVFFSASMQPFGYYKRLLGTGTDASELDIASAFPQENLGLYTLGLDTSYRGREGSLEALGQALADMVAAREGNYLFYFPSYAYMRRVYECFAGFSQARTLMQHSGMDERQRREFLQEFDQAGQGSLAAFAVMGGIFGEGIDLAGERLIGVAVVGVGLPQIGLPRDQIRAYHNNLMEDGFAYAYVVPGFNKVLQAAGRVIRTAQDRGVVLLIDKRFTREDYQALYPPHWSHARAVRPGQVRPALAAFWQNAPGAE